MICWVSFGCSRVVWLLCLRCFFFLDVFFFGRCFYGFLGLGNMFFRNFWGLLVVFLGELCRAFFFFLVLWLVWLF